MSKTKFKILFALVLVCTLVCSFCFATVEPRTGDAQPTSEEGVAPISEDQETTSTSNEPNASWTNSDLFVAEDKVTISSVVDGNAFVVGKEVTVSGEIGGDLFVFADKLNIEGGYVYSSIFACANEITINGVVYDVYAACDTFNLEASGFVYRDMKVTAANVNLNGKVRRDAYISANTMNFREGSETIIYGNLHYANDSELAIPEGVVAGEVTYEKTNTQTNMGKSVGSYVKDLVKTLLFTFIVTLVLLWLTPKFVQRVGNMSTAKTFISLGIGFATPIAFVMASFLLILTMIGLPIFACGLFAFILLAYIGFSVTSIYFGKLLAKLFKMQGNVKFVLLTLVSALVLWLIHIIPVVGGIFSFIISLFGIGATLVNMVYRKEKEQEQV